MEVDIKLVAPCDPIRIPPNKGSVISSHIYAQIRDWFQHMIIPWNDRTRKDKDWLCNFKFKLNDNSYLYPYRENADRDRGGGYKQRRRDNDHPRDRASGDYRGRWAHWENSKNRGRDSTTDDYEIFMN